jgi:hypothetical protein
MVVDIRVGRGSKLHGRFLQRCRYWHVPKMDPAVLLFSPSGLAKVLEATVWRPPCPSCMVCRNTARTGSY